MPQAQAGSMSGSELGLKSGWMYGNLLYENGDTDDETASKERKGSQ